MLYKGGYFILKNVLIEYIKTYAFFYFIDSVLNVNENILIRSSEFVYMWEKDISCQTIITNFSEIYNNDIIGCIFRDLSIKNEDFLLESSFIFDNTFNQTNGAGIIQTQTGILTLDKSYFFNNYFLNHKIFRYFMEINIETIFSVKNSVFIDNGIIEKKSSYFVYSDDNVISLWNLYYSYFENILMMTTDSIEMLGGFISASPHWGYFELINSKFILKIYNHVFEYKGLQIDSAVIAILINNTFYNLQCSERSFSTKYGGVCLYGSTSYTFSKGQNNFQLYMKNNTFFNSSCEFGGGLAIFSIKKIEISDLFFYGSITKNKGGAFILVGSEDCSLKNIQIFNTQAYEGGAAFIQNIFQMKIQNLYISNATAFSTAVIYLKGMSNMTITNITTNQTYSGLKGGVITVFKSTLMIFRGSFTNTMSKVEGGMLYCDDRSNVILNNTNIENSFSDKGGAFSIVNAIKFSLLNCNIFNSSSKNDGGVFVLSSFSVANLVNVSIDNSKSFFGIGIVFIQNTEENSLIYINKLKCNDNFATDGSCILYTSSSLFFCEDLIIENNGNNPIALYGAATTEVEIKHLVLVNSSSEKFLIYCLNLYLKIANFNISNNFAGISVFEGESILNTTFFNGTFFDNFCKQILQLKKSSVNLISLAVIAVRENADFLTGDENNLKINNCNFSQGNSSKSLGLIFLSNSFFYVENGIFSENKGILMYFSECLVVKIENSTYLKNFNLKTENMPNDIYIENIEEILTNLFLLNNIFKVSYGFSLYFIGSVSTFLENCTFINVGSEKNIRAMLFYSNPNITINGVLVKNFTESALFIYNGIEKKNIKISIKDSIFIQNTAQKGSSIYLQGNMNVTLSKCNFTNNQAIIKNQANTLEGVAPCLFFKPWTKDSSSIKLSNCTFLNNRASYIAPTIFSQTPILYNNDSFFENNLDNLAFSKKMFVFPLEVNLYKIISEFENKVNENFVKIPTILINSGSEIYLEFLFQDQFHQTLIFDNKSIFTIRPIDNRISIKLAGSITQVSKGIVTYPNLLIKVKPDSNFSLTLSSSFEAIVKETIEQKISLKLNFYSRKCRVGETILVDDSCVRCPAKTFSLSDPMLLEQKYQKCNICPEFCECLGGSQITPLPGFYRYSNYSVRVVPCFNPESCIGNVILNSSECNSSCSEQIQIHGACSAGNVGPLCSICEENFGKVNFDSSCKECPSVNSVIISRLFSYVVCLSFYLFFNSYIAEKYQSDQRDDGGIGEASLLIKIIINHAQQINLILLNEVDLPFSDIKSFFSFSDMLSFTNDQVIINECVFNFLNKISLNINLFKIILNSLIPLFFSILTSLLWLIFIFPCNKHYREKGKLRLLYSKSKLFLILSIFMFYPLIIKSCFGILECIKLDPNVKTTFLKIYLELECWSDYHYTYIFFISLPGLIIWGVGLPLFLTVSLKRSFDKSRKTFSQKSHVSDSENTLKNSESTLNLGAFSIFRKGYKTKYFFWESLILGRKFLLSLIVILTSILLDEIKWLLILLIFLIFLRVTFQHKPYSIDSGNTFEQNSLMICIFSGAACFSFNSKINESLKQGWCLLIILLNIFYFGYGVFLVAKCYLKYLKFLKEIQKIRKTTKQIVQKRMKSLKK